LPDRDDDYHLYDLFGGVTESSSFIEKWEAKVKYDKERTEVA